MSEGASYAAGFFWALKNQLFPNIPGTNVLDGGAHFYGCYETSDNRWMALGAIEPQFYSDLVKKLELENELKLSDQMNPDSWESGKTPFFRTVGNLCKILQAKLFFQAMSFISF